MFIRKDINDNEPEGVTVARGIVNGVILSLGLWGIIIGSVVLILSFF